MEKDQICPTGIIQEDTEGSRMGIGFKKNMPSSLIKRGLIKNILA
jgi:hypothetical protein